MNDEWIDPDAAKAQRKVEKAAKQRLAQDDAVIQSLMSSVDGRAWMRELLEICGVFRTTFTGEALQSAFNEGTRNIGLRVLAALMRACPDAYIQMMKEQNDGGRTGSDGADDADGDTEE